jgi:hypothetical protein
VNEKLFEAARNVWLMSPYLAWVVFAGLLNAGLGGREINASVSYDRAHVVRQASPIAVVRMRPCQQLLVLDRTSLTIERGKSPMYKRRWPRLPYGQLLLYFAATIAV